MKRLGRVMAGVGHTLALLVAGVIGAGTTPWLLKKLEQEDEEVGRLR